MSALAAAITLSGACVADGAAAPSAGEMVRSPRTLAGCVAVWNKASLGTGRTVIRLNAVGDDRALMFRFTDAGCGLVFAPAAPPASNSDAVFVAVLHGAYSPSDTPLSGHGSSHPVRTDAPLEQLAASHTNVRVSRRTGLVTADRGATIQVLDYTLHDAGSACRRIVAPPSHEPVPESYTLTKANASCAWARTLIFAYVAGQGSRLNPGSSRPPVRLIAGWRCAGAGGWRAHNPTTWHGRFTLTCIRGHQRIHAPAFYLHVIGQPGAPQPSRTHIKPHVDSTHAGAIPVARKPTLR